MLRMTRDQALASSVSGAVTPCPGGDRRSWHTVDDIGDQLRPVQGAAPDALQKGWFCAAIASLNTIVKHATPAARAFRLLRAELRIGGEGPGRCRLDRVRAVIRMWISATSKRQCFGRKGVLDREGQEHVHGGILGETRGRALGTSAANVARMRDETFNALQAAVGRRLRLRHPDVGSWSGEPAGKA